MKKILITGANSYIGTSFAQYMAQWPQEYQVATIDMIDGNWRDKSFTGYDCVFHVAGIAHINTKKLDEQAKRRYWKVNALLPVEVAQKAKAEGAGQFVFLSSMSVYGEHGSIKHPVVITRETKPAPKDIYGESKLKAEEGILTLDDKGFRVCILRPPMIYGPGCKGNYQLLEKAALKLPLFPDFINERSVLSINNLCVCVKTIIDETLYGMHFPQDKEYICTSKMIKSIAELNGRNIYFTSLFNYVIYLLSEKVYYFDKIFGGLMYEKSMTGFPERTTAAYIEYTNGMDDGSK